VRGDEIVRVDPRNMRVLLLLTSRAGQVISQSEIERIAWKGVAVTPDSVYQSIAQLRRALGAGRYIETVPRKGYRLIAQVRPELPVPEPLPTRRKGRQRLLWIASITMAALVVVVVAWFGRADEKRSAVTQTVQAESPHRFRGDRTIRQAIAYLETQLKIQSETAGADAPALVTILSRLSNLYLLLSDPRSSEVSARRGLAILEKLTGKRGADGIELHATLAEALADRGQFADAESHLQTALELARDLHGATHETTSAILQQFALLRIAQRRFEDAEQLARRALDVHRHLPEAGTARAAYLTSTIAWALIEQGRAAEAIRPMDEALAAIQPDDPPAPYLVALAHHFRGKALNRVGRYPEAEAAFRTELDLFAKITRVKMDEARAMSALAEARLMQGDISDAAALLTEARSLLKDGEGWRESEARHEADRLIRQLQASVQRGRVTAGRN